MAKTEKPVSVPIQTIPDLDLTPPQVPDLVVEEPQTPSLVLPEKEPKREFALCSICSFPDNVTPLTVVTCRNCGQQAMYY